MVCVLFLRNVHLAISHHFYKADSSCTSSVLQLQQLPSLPSTYSSNRLPSFQPPCMQSTAVHSSSTAPPCVCVPRASQDHICLCVLLLLYQEPKSYYSCQSPPIPIHLNLGFPAVLKSEMEKKTRTGAELPLPITSVTVPVTHLQSPSTGAFTPVFRDKDKLSL